MVQALTRVVVAPAAALVWVGIALGCSKTPSAASKSELGAEAGASATVPLERPALDAATSDATGGKLSPSLAKKIGLLLALDASADATVPCDPVADRDGYCTPDGGATVLCEGKPPTLVIGSICTGPNGCVMRPVNGDAGPLTTWCDLSVAAIGQACGKYDHGRLTCNADAGAQLRCDSMTSKYMLDQICAPGKPCHWDGHEGECIP